MAEGRMLKKEISDSKKLGRLPSDRPRVLYFMMLPHLDIVGRMYADPEKIKGQVVTMLRYSTASIQKALEQLHEVGLITLYSENGDQYLEYTRFSDFQKLYPDRESKTKIPAPTHDNSCARKINPLKLSKVKLSKEKRREEKGKYLQFVFLTKEEYKKLVQRYGLKPAQRLIDSLDYYISNNKKGKDPYTDHYRTLCKWAKKDNIPELQQKNEDEADGLEKRQQELRTEHWKYFEEKTTDELKAILADPKDQQRINLGWLIKEILDEKAKQN